MGLQWDFFCVWVNGCCIGFRWCLVNKWNFIFGWTIPLKDGPVWFALILQIQTLCWWDSSSHSTCTHLLWAQRCRSQTCCPRCWARFKLSVLWPVQQWERMGGLWCLNSISRHYPLRHLLLVFSVCHAGHVALEEAWSCLRDCLSWSKNTNTWFRDAQHFPG